MSRCEEVQRLQPLGIHLGSSELAAGQVQEVLQVLKEVKDPAMGDIVSCGFVSGIKADRVTGNISLQLVPRRSFKSLSKAHCWCQGGGSLPGRSGEEIARLTLGQDRERPSGHRKTSSSETYATDAQVGFRKQSSEII